jgi:phosphoglycerate dehydrogenase-like enzyme
MSVSILIYEPDSARDARSYGQAVTREFPDVEVFATSDRNEAIALAPRITALAAKAGDVVPELVAAAPRLDWIQALTTGVDPLHALRLPHTVTITSARGIHGPQMAELAMLLMLSLGRNLPKILANQRESKWQRWGQPLLLGKTVVIVGVGTISEVLAARCRAFGLRVIGITSRIAACDFDELHPRARLREVAARADFLVVLVPYSPDTHHMIDAAVLASMKPTAFLINIARGNVIDEPALIDALRARRIAGAGLDVFATEPLPPTSPLWTFDNVVVTPHVGGLSDVYVEQVIPVLLDNLRAYRAGDRAAMRNVVAR